MSDGTYATERPPFWRDVRILKIVAQVVVVGAVLLVTWVLLGNLTTNLERQGLRTDFGFIDGTIRFAIPDLVGSASFPFWRAMLVGMKNTALVAFVGIFFATVIGVLIGVMRLSTNWLTRKFAALYVEAFRNTPVLVVIVIFYFAIFLAMLPPIGGAWEWAGGALVVSNGGIWIPWFAGREGAALYWAVVLLALVGAVAVAWWRTRRFDRTGRAHHRVLWGLGVGVMVLLVGYAVLGGPFGATTPERTQFGATGGFKVNVAYAALTVALAMYTASHIAEIVRGSILAVPKGQSEAARAVGLSEFQRMRYVVLPQALRILIPPLGNQYLNLTKNSSLAVAIGFYELTRIAFVTTSQGFPAPQVIGILMLTYLVFSLSISAVTNYVNARLQVATRR